MHFLNSNMDKYDKIIEIICRAKGIEKEELFKILKDRECKYLMFLLLKKYKCLDLEKLSKDFSIESRKTINYNFKKAEERFFVSKEFRDMYFELEETVEKTIGENK